MFYWLLDPAKFLAPAKELAHMDSGRTGNLRDNRARLEAGGYKPLFLFARPTPTALTDVMASIGCFVIGLSLVFALGHPMFTATSQGGLHRGLTEQANIRASSSSASWATTASPVR